MGLSYQIYSRTSTRQPSYPRVIIFLCDTVRLYSLSENDDVRKKAQQAVERSRNNAGMLRRNCI
nr:MAG TPA: hypothetical protein [Caudoviricetes sp.]